MIGVTAHRRCALKYILTQDQEFGIIYNIRTDDLDSIASSLGLKFDFSVNRREESVELVSICLSRRTLICILI